MKKYSILLKLKSKLASIGWKLFIWGNNFTEEEYWSRIYEQEKNHIEKLNH